MFKNKYTSAQESHRKGYLNDSKAEAQEHVVPVTFRIVGYEHCSQMQHEKVLVTDFFIPEVHPVPKEINNSAINANNIHGGEQIALCN